MLGGGFQQHNGGSPPSTRVIGIVKRFDPVERAQKALHPFALHSHPPSVDQSDLPETALPRFQQILVRDVFYVGRAKGMKVENVLDRHLERLVRHAPDSMRYSLF